MNCSLWSLLSFFNSSGKIGKFFFYFIAQLSKLSSNWTGTIKLTTKGDSLIDLVLENWSVFKILMWFHQKKTHWIYFQSCHLGWHVRNSSMYLTFLTRVSYMVYYTTKIEFFTWNCKKLVRNWILDWIWIK